MLLTFTTIVNSVALAAAVWLGLYVVTRSPRSLVAWLTGLTLWSMSGLFLNVLLALHPPPAPENLPGWVYWVLPFWRPSAFAGEAGAWLQGWLLTPAVAFWHHATTLMRPGRMTRWRWFRVVAGYAGAATAVVAQRYTGLMFIDLSGDPLYLNTLRPGPLFPIFAAWLLLFALMSLFNLSLSARAAPAAMPRKQLLILAAATLIAGLSGPISVVTLALGLPVPRVVLSLLLGCAVSLIGYGVAQYSAVVDGRVIRRDFIYNGVAVALVSVLYVLATWVEVRAYEVSPAAYVLVLTLVVITHSLVDVAQQVLDRLFYRRGARQVRASLRQLAGTVGERGELDDTLAALLRSLCATFRATYGLIVLFEADGPRLAADAGWHGGDLLVTTAQLSADDVVSLRPGSFARPLTEAALLMPLYAEARQVGALILGQPVNGVQYSQADVEALLSPSDRIADTIRDARHEAEHLSRIAELLQADMAPPASEAPSFSTKLVEEGLRNLANYARLGELPLAEWGLARQRLPQDGHTSLDRGKAVYGMLTDAIEKLRPEGSLPRDPPPREWHRYLILHSAYVRDTPNRDIMSQLYISEGTFNRTRRAALQAVANSLAEMEQALKA